MRVFILIIVTFALLAFGMHACEQTDSAKEERRKDAERRAAESRPHVIREADGCKVYAFKLDARWHYFTRCPNASTTTDSPYTVCTGSANGRSCTTKTESIETR
jgi:hypothetical protein